MDVSEKIRALRSEIEAAASREIEVKGRIRELKQLLDEKKKHDESIITLLEEEKRLLELL
jgi:hypothetical protein